MKIPSDWEGQRVILHLERPHIETTLFINGMDIDSDLDKRIVAKRMRNAIMNYVASEDFKPTITLTPEIITDFFTKETAPVEMYTNETPDELKPKLK